MTETRARQLVTLITGYVCDFIAGVLSVDGDLREFEGTAEWLHQAEHWQLRGAGRDGAGHGGGAAAGPAAAVDGGGDGGGGSGRGSGGGVQRQQQQGGVARASM